jgi:hypothetical protein
MDHRRYERSIPEIVGDLLTQFPTLARTVGRGKAEVA